MHGFWADRLRNQTLFLYLFAPFFQQTATLLIVAESLWSPWAVKRKEELLNVASRLKHLAEMSRKKGLAWACNDNEFGADPAGILSPRAFGRYYRKETREAFPRAVPLLVSAATKTLFALLPILEKFERTAVAMAGTAAILKECVETLYESPCIGLNPDISEAAILRLAEEAVLLECEGLAYMQAMIEDNFYFHNPNASKKKKSDITDDEIRKLAEEIGVSFSQVKDVFETEYSSWWQVSNSYSRQAEEKRKIFLAGLGLEKSAQDLIFAAWNPGMPTETARPRVWGSITKTEAVLRRCIAMFLFLLKTEQFSEQGKFPLAQFALINKETA